MPWNRRAGCQRYENGSSFASKSKDIAFIVLMAGLGVTGKK